MVASRKTLHSCLLQNPGNASCTLFHIHFPLTKGRVLTKKGHKYSNPFGLPEASSRTELKEMEILVMISVY